MRHSLGLVILVLLIAPASMIGQRLISGKIVDSQSGKNLNKTLVLSAAGQEIAKSDTKGLFKLTLANNDTIVFTRKGYYSEAVVIGEGKFFKVGLTKIRKKDKNVEIGYGSQNSREVTSAVVSISEEEFNKGVVTDIYQLLRGKVPGLVIQHDPGNPTSEPRIILRGTTAFNGINEPLIVVDGAQGISLSTVDPNDVANVTVLKDASAQAMYGSRANGGVILIQTKKK